MLNCNMMIRSLQCVARDLPMYDGLTSVDEFLNKFESEASEQQQFDALKWELCAMPAKWWDMHQQSFKDWHDYRKMMHLRFGRPPLRMRTKFEERNNLCDHLSRWI